ncbi:unnamed protein product [Caenorhabditis auriculariae]|uniref:Uncharacterized protein n=1 Tax=Caenorhabditis auriculariae TaxID=2777116 RepID=A0A8S1HCP1_9PELO|nr:unnamed protein product [Caenorhabditis auriculariae]
MTLHDEDAIFLKARFDATLEECDFLARWPSRGGPKLKLNLQKFWQLASKATGDVTEDDVNGLQVLLVIEAKRVYDEGLAGLYCDWFTLDDPSQLMRLFVNNQPVPHHLLWNLVCRVCAVSVELYDVQQMSAKATVARFASASPSTSTSLTWLQYNNLPMPLFYVPDDQ